MRLVHIIIRHLVQRPVRTAVTVICVAAAVGGFTVLTGLGRGLETAWNGSLVKQGTHLMAHRKGVMNLLTGAIDERIADELKAVEGVESVSTELIDVITLESGASVLVRGWPGDSVLWGQVALISGRLPDPHSRDQVVVGEGLAQSLDIQAGGVLSPFGGELRVAGVARLDNVLGNNSLMMPLSGLQDLLDRQGKITVVHLRVEGGDHEKGLETARARLSEKYPQFLFVAAQTAAQENELYRFWRGMSWAASLVGLIMGLLIVFNTMLVAVLEKTREIGVLNAVGWSGRRIITLIMLESLALSAAGGLAGIACGYLGLKLLVLHPKLQGFILVAPSWSALAEQSAVILAIGLGAGLIPAWRALKLNPIDALRER